MKILNFGGATAIVEHNGKRILFDPWLDEGIFHGSWHHFPPLKMGLGDLGRLDYVYISHIHEDHCSLKTLQVINRDAEILIIDRKPNYVLNFLKSNNLHFRKIWLIPEKTPTRISDQLTVDMLKTDPNHELNYLVDSMLMLKWDKFLIFNQNDCPMHEDAYAYIAQHYNRIDLALLSYAGGSGYPSCYSNLTQDEKHLEASRILKSGMDSFYEAIERLDPCYVLPFADQYVVVGSRAKFNEFMAHPSSAGAVIDHLDYAKYKNQIILLNSGQSFDLEQKRFFPTDEFKVYTDKDRSDYVMKHSQNVTYDYEKITFARSVPFKRFLELSRNRLWNEQERRSYFIDFRFYIDILENEIVEIDLRYKEINTVPTNQKKQPYLVLKGSRDLMIMMMIGHISWNIADAALFIDYERVPNEYNTIVHALVNFLRI